MVKIEKKLRELEGARRLGGGAREGGIELVHSDSMPEVVVRRSSSSKSDKGGKRGRGDDEEG